MIRVEVSYTSHDGTTRSVNVDGDWHLGLGPGSFTQEAWAPAFEAFGISVDDPRVKAIQAEVVGEMIDGRLHAKLADGTCSGCNEVRGSDSGPLSPEQTSDEAAQEWTGVDPDLPEGARTLSEVDLFFVNEPVNFTPRGTPYQMPCSRMAASNKLREPGIPYLEESDFEGHGDGYKPTDTNPVKDGYEEPENPWPPVCIRCRGPLAKPGAIINTPPKEPKTYAEALVQPVSKVHVCDTCWPYVWAFLNDHIEQMRDDEVVEVRPSTVFDRPIRDGFQIVSKGESGYSEARIFRNGRQVWTGVEFSALMMERLASPPYGLADSAEVEHILSNLIDLDENGPLGITPSTGPKKRDRARRAAITSLADRARQVLGEDEPPSDFIIKVDPKSQEEVERIYLPGGEQAVRPFEGKRVPVEFFRIAAPPAITSEPVPEVEQILRSLMLLAQYGPECHHGEQVSDKAMRKAFIREATKLGERAEEVLRQMRGDDDTQAEIRMAIDATWPGNRIAEMVRNAADADMEAIEGRPLYAQAPSAQPVAEESFLELLGRLVADHDETTMGEEQHIVTMRAIVAAVRDALPAGGFEAEEDFPVATPPEGHPKDGSNKYCANCGVLIRWNRSTVPGFGHWYHRFEGITYVPCVPEHVECCQQARPGTEQVTTPDGCRIATGGDQDEGYCYEHQTFHEPSDRLKRDLVSDECADARHEAQEINLARAYDKAVIASYEEDGPVTEWASLVALLALRAAKREGRTLEVLEALEQRTQEALPFVQHLAESISPDNEDRDLLWPLEHSRLSGKIDGMATVGSYINEAVREEQARG